MDTEFNNSPYGLLLHEKDLALQKKYFVEMTRLIGINVIYREPKPDKHWTDYSEIDSNYEPPVLVGCIFNEHPDQKTMKKLGWSSELQEAVSLISVPYDLQGISVGALFIIPDVYNKKKGRLFRVTQISTIMIAPASLTCQLTPEFEDTFKPAMNQHIDNTFNYLNVEDEPNMHNG